MKLFLASSADKTLHLLRHLSPETGKRVLFVANAADLYRGPHFWVEDDKNRFVQLGYKCTDLDLQIISSNEIKTALNNTDILHICGGSEYYLIHLIRERDLETVIIDAISKSNIVYTGTSAGAIIVSKNMKAFSYTPEEEEAKYVSMVHEYNGFGLVDFLVVPHSNNPDFSASRHSMIDHMASDPTPLIFLHDHQAVWAEDDTLKIICA